MYCTRPGLGKADPNAVGSGFISGAAQGSSAGPFGAIAGAIAGAAQGFFGSSAADSAAKRQAKLMRELAETAQRTERVKAAYAAAHESLDYAARERRASTAWGFGALGGLLLVGGVAIYIATRRR